jgi:hypothetical protein
MSLEISLRARRTLYAFVDAESAVVAEISRNFPEIDDPRVCEIAYQIGSVINAVEIHQWFVDNVQGGADNCAIYTVDRGDLRDLRNKCDSIIEASETSCFTASYIQQFHDIVSIIDHALNLPDNWAIEYRAIW